jgi:hypothetical protein
VAATPISDIVATIEVVRTMQRTLADLAEVVERLGDRVVALERRLDRFEEDRGGD